MNEWLVCPDCGTSGEDTYQVFYPRHGEPRVEIEFVCLNCSNHESTMRRTGASGSTEIDEEIEQKAAELVEQMEE